LLVTHFQREVGGRSGRAGSGFTVAALEALAWYGWPGNVGELRAEVLRLMTRAASDLVVEVGDLAPHIREALAADDSPPPTSVRWRRDRLPTPAATSSGGASSGRSWTPDGTSLWPPSSSACRVPASSRRCASSVWSGARAVASDR
jgi:DNA-binding NtrC family response regulator